MPTSSKDKTKKRICIGIPCFQGVTYEVLDDYMRFAYHLGRRCTEYDFYLAIKPKSAQHRARNAIVEAAVATFCDYLLMLDDDQIIDIEKHLGPNDSYDFLMKLVKHLEDDPKKGIVGALYFQRGATCDPVIMYRNPPGYTFYQMQDISRRLQKVDVTGGGAMCINMKVFDKIESPWFMDEMAVSSGTDIQICDKVAKAGWEIWCDTSIELGHIMTDREIVSSKNAQDVRMKASEWMNREDIRNAPGFKSDPYINEYDRDIKEYTGKTEEELVEMREEYDNTFFPRFDINDLKGYYASLGLYQLARNWGYHKIDRVDNYGRFILSLFNPAISAKGLDFGCGSAPIGFELAIKGHSMSFVDIPDSEAIKFVKWRCDKYEINDRCGFKLGEDYDFILMMDVIEHLHPDTAEDTLVDIISRLKPGGSIVTSYWITYDYRNAEHIFMKHDKVKELFKHEGMFSMPILVDGGKVEDTRWVKEKK